MSMYILAPMLSIAILFVVLATQMWTRSISTAVHGVTVAATIYLYPTCGIEICMAVLFTGVFINMSRAVITTDRDRLVKRGSIKAKECIIPNPYGDDEHCTGICV